MARKARKADLYPQEVEILRHYRQRGTNGGPDAAPLFQDLSVSKLREMGLLTITGWHHSVWPFYQTTPLGLAALRAHGA